MFPGCGKGTLKADLLLGVPQSRKRENVEEVEISPELGCAILDALGKGVSLRRSVEDRSPYAGT